MGLITKTKTWADAENVTYTDINANFDGVYNEVNGSLDNNNIKSGAAIAESKISFDTASGHHHDGTDSRAIPKGFVFTVTGTLTTGTSVSPLLVATAAQTITKVYVNTKSNVSSDLVIDLNINGTSIWNTNQANRAKIASGSNSGTQTSFDTTALTEGDVITLDIDSVGTAADLTVVVKA